MKRNGQNQRLRTLFAGGAAFILLIFAGCLTDPDDGPSYRPIDVQFLRFPSHLNPNVEAESIDVAFYVGPNGCWELEEIGLEISGRTIVVSGMAMNENEPDGVCPQVLVFGEIRLPLPPLESGTYEIRSCGMTDTITIDDAAGPVTNRLLLKGSFWSVEGTCGLFHAGSVFAEIAGLPESVPDGTLIVWADEAPADDSCGFPGQSADVFASFRRLTAYSP